MQYWQHQLILYRLLPLVSLQVKVNKDRVKEKIYWRKQQGTALFELEVVMKSLLTEKELSTHDISFTSITFVRSMNMHVVLRSQKSKSLMIIFTLWSQPIFRTCLFILSFYLLFGGEKWKADSFDHELWTRIKIISRLAAALVLVSPQGICNSETRSPWAPAETWYLYFLRDFFFASLSLKSTRNNFKTGHAEDLPALERNANISIEWVVYHDNANACFVIIRIYINSTCFEIQ